MFVVGALLVGMLWEGSSVELMVKYSSSAMMVSPFPIRQ